MRFGLVCEAHLGAIGLQPHQHELKQALIPQPTSRVAKAKLIQLLRLISTSAHARRCQSSQLCVNPLQKPVTVGVNITDGFPFEQSRRFEEVA
ncbi:hypothetical protein EBE87_23200 [Pseudoroseomonas wenyumeiae]|uniref:Uncharacterized protein n=1 Tax=Teichococcus wenyumeiae TaxID=2478470 RepID=A0A3A9JIQ3_9PROT|nr:hypothetical protein D6Z83_08110 [Pseudoroseomonas wenyumeiae]RMI17334.1 hypothetical protein EBE87_23200 [Pseudoroseomonas wenyumeiae]